MIFYVRLRNSKHKIPSKKTIIYYNKFEVVEIKKYFTLRKQLAELKKEISKDLIIITLIRRDGTKTVIGNFKNNS